MEPEKVIVQPPPPPYKGFKVKQTPTLVAVGVACAFGTALLVVSILGGIWINNLKGQVTQGTMATGEKEETGRGFEKTFNINIKIDNDDKSVSETVNLDKVKNEEVDLQYDDNGELEYVSVMDFATNIYGSYSAAGKECYIYHAGDHKYDSVDDLLDNVYDGDEPLVDISDGPNLTYKQEIHYNSSRMDYFMDKKPITDHSILPDNLKPYCEEKEVYWLRAMEKCGVEEEHERQKRDTYYCVGGYWRYGGRCCGCSCPRTPYCGCWDLYICVGGTIVRG